MTDPRGFRPSGCWAGTDSSDVREVSVLESSVVDGDGDELIEKRDGASVKEWED